MRTHNTLARWLGGPSLILLALSLIAALPTDAQAAVYYFTRITNNGGAAAVDAQLSVVVTSFSATQVDFTFHNVGTAASSITDVYFDDGTLVANPTVVNGPGVNYSPGATPGNLPGGGPINFNSTAGFNADSNPPPVANGVNNTVGDTEFVTIRFTLQSGKTFADVLAAIELGANNPGVDMTDGLRIGIHVQGFQNGASESYVNTPNAVPAPPTVLMLFAGLGGLAAFRLPGMIRSRFQKKATV